MLNKGQHGERSRTEREAAGAAIPVFLGARKTQSGALGAGLRGGSREDGQRGRSREASLIPSGLRVMPRQQMAKVVK